MSGGLPAEVAVMGVCPLDGARGPTRRLGSGSGGKEGGRRWGVPALLVPGVVPLDEPLGALQLGVQAVLLTPVPGHALGGDAETERDGVGGGITAPWCGLWVALVCPDQATVASSLLPGWFCGRSWLSPNL